MTKLSGRSLIGFREGSGTDATLFATNPVIGEDLQPAFFSATVDEVKVAVELAAQSFEAYQRVTGRERGAFLRKIATNIESIAG